MAVSNAHIKATRKYEKSNYGKITIQAKKIYIDTLNQFCKINGYTKNSFVLSATIEKIERDTGKTIEQLARDYEKLSDPKSIDDLDILEEYTFKDKDIKDQG